jgi:hypothetical protein
MDLTGILSLSIRPALLPGGSNMADLVWNQTLGIYYSTRPSQYLDLELPIVFKACFARIKGIFSCHFLVYSSK